MSAENNVKLLCEAILHFDEEGLKKFNYSREDLFKQWTGSFVETMKRSANNIFTDKQSAQIANAMMNAIKKVNITTNATDDESKVEVVVNGLNFAGEFNEKNMRLEIDFSATRDEIAASMVKMLVKKFESMKPARTTVFVLDCVYDKSVDFWVPKDAQAFFDTLSTSAMGGK